MIIRHGNTIVIYSHLQPGLRIGNIGDPVAAGQWIGEIAAHPNGAHLHLEVRTYGALSFDSNITPLIFVNPWQYFDATNQAHINQNLINRANDDGAAVAAPSTQPTQCFRSPTNPPPGAPPSAVTGITVYGLTSIGGSPTYQAFEWVAGTGTQTYTITTSGANWQTICMP